MWAGIPIIYVKAESRIYYVIHLRIVTLNYKYTYNLGGNMLIKYYDVPYFSTTGKKVINIWASVHCSDGQYWHVYIGPSTLPPNELEERKNTYVYQHIKRGTVC